MAWPLCITHIIDFLGLTFKILIVDLPIGKFHNMIFIFSSLLIFFSKEKVIKYSLFIYIFHIYEKFQTKKKTRHVYFNVFNHIVTFWKNYMIFLCMIGAINIFGKNNFIFSFVGLVTWGWVHIWGGVKEKKMSKDECEYFYKQIRMNHLT